MAEDMRALIEDLVMSESRGDSVLVLVDDYLEREQLAAALIEEGGLYGITMLQSRTPEDAERQWAGEDRDRERAALALIDAGAAEPWALWLGANREALPQWLRFLVVLMTPQDVPTLARLAPAFMSWAKGLEFRKLAIAGEIPRGDVTAELARMERETGLSPRAFVEAWQRGELPDTLRNTTWLSLAWARSAKERDG